MFLQPRFQKAKTEIRKEKGMQSFVNERFTNNAFTKCPQARVVICFIQSSGEPQHIFTKINDVFVLFPKRKQMTAFCFNCFTESHLFFRPDDSASENVKDHRIITYSSSGGKINICTRFRGS